jgi:N-acetyl-gamma-glutamyl-phosphate reductase
VAKVGVVGASGYAGAVCAALLASHPDLELAFATSDKAAGEPVRERLGLPGRSSLRFARHEEAEALARGVDAVLLATSAEQSMALAPKLAAHARVVDLSGAFRLEGGAYPKWYGFDHAAKAELERAWYGLPELFGPPPKDARIVANPGCYATAALLAIAPLLRDGVALGDRVVVDGKSGVSGAGRRAEDTYSFVELAEEMRAYKVGSHQHTPEIARHAGRYASATPDVVFVPHLVPLRRGLIVTAYLTAAPGATTDAAHACLEHAYGNAPFVRVAPPDRVAVHAVAGTPLALVGAHAAGGTIVVTCAIDNLMKGAASQAVQNLNLLLGLSETAGLGGGMRFAP